VVARVTQGRGIDSSREDRFVLYVVIIMLVILAVAAVVVLYAAYPHRGEEMPAAPWLGDAMSKAVDKLPTVAPTSTEERSMDFHR
jgi:hypothetical protein